jgi:biotin carboxylase
MISFSKHALREEGLITRRHALVKQLADCLPAMCEIGSWPVVLKPTESFGAANVSICTDFADLEQAYRRATDQGDARTPPEMVAEGFLSGLEYEVNTVSWNGTHKVTDIWSYTKQKNTGSIIYDWGRLLGEEEQMRTRLTSYALQVLNALGIRYGPAHLEICDTSDGPTLIEIGARLCGGSAPEIVKHCTGYGQHEAVADAFCSPEKFLPQDAILRTRALCLNVHLICPRDGSKLDSVGIRELEALPNFLRLDSPHLGGSRLRKTKDLLSSPGTVRFVAEKWEQLAPRVEQVRSIERESLYVEL